MRDVRGHVAMRGETGQHLLAALEIAEERMTEDSVAAAGIARRDPSPLLTRRRQRNEVRRGRHWKPLQQRLIEGRENRGVGADAERKREDGCKAEDRRFAQGFDRGAEIGEKPISH